MTGDIDLKNCFYKDLDTNFEIACKLAEQDFTHEQLLQMLISGSIPEKQIAALKFDSINNENDCKILLDNLTECDGKIREAVALKFFKLLSDSEECREITAKISYKTFADATIDINGNICRYIVDSAALMKPYTSFSIPYSQQVIKFINDALSELDKFIFRDKKYVINKQLFKLYWCLETLTNFHEFVDFSIMEPLLLKCASQNEYTIREKTAQIAILSEKYKNIAGMLKNDENYYVREIILNHQGIF